MDPTVSQIDVRVSSTCSLLLGPGRTSVSWKVAILDESNDLVKNWKILGLRGCPCRKKSGYVSLLPRVSIGSLLPYGTHEGSTLFFRAWVGTFFELETLFPIS